MNFTRRALLGAAPVFLGLHGARAQRQSRLAVEYEDVQRLAAQLANTPHNRPASDLPSELQDLSYDQYKDIRFRPERTIALGQSAFAVQTFHPGFLFKHSVNLNIVTATGVSPVPYSADFFNFGKNRPPKVSSNIGFAGFKVIYPLNQPGKLDEVISFLGASYFRFLGRGQRYGASARALAVGSGDPNEPEEFPFLKEFWLIEPSSERQLTMLALLDSVSGTGAYEFIVTPSEETEVQVRATLYARKEWGRLGIAPLTSMFYTRKGPRIDPNEFRPQVHDTDTLLVRYEGRWLVRSLDNPQVFRHTNVASEVQGFGLTQRERRFDAYQDVEANYHLRPGYWIEPSADWREGFLHLVELPTKSETEDNIVAFWQPPRSLPAGQSMEWRYRIRALSADPPHDLGRFLGFQASRAKDIGDAWLSRSVVLDFAGGDLEYALKDLGSLQLATECAPGSVVSSRLLPRRSQQGVRAMMEVRGPKPGPLLIRAELRQGERTLTEVAAFVLNPEG
jgi:glucans biosynthesis protein